MGAFKHELEFWKTPICHHEPGTLQYFQSFWMRAMVIVMSVIFWWCTIKCDIQETCLSDQVFCKRPIHDVTISCMSHWSITQDGVYRFESNSDSACLWQVSPFIFSLFTDFQKDGILMFCFVLVNMLVGSAHGISSAWRREGHTVYSQLHSNLFTNSPFIKKLSLSESLNQAVFLHIFRFPYHIYSYWSFPNKFIKYC